MRRADVFFVVLTVTLALATGFYAGNSHDRAVYRTSDIASPEPANSTVYRSAYRKLMDSVVSVKVFTPQGESQGSGFLYREKYIVTNHHVIQNAEAVNVRFSRGEWSSASVIGSDIYTDLAVLKVSDPPEYTEPLPVAENDPAPGTRVMALGNPYGLQQTITHGIVSGVNRTMSTTGGFTIPDTVQTDAPINPGNSGGPLVNTRGVVVGVNRAKQGDNIGFAISPALIQRVVPELIQDGSYEHPYLGISMKTVSPLVAEVNDLEKSRGVIVREVLPGGPASGKLLGSEYSARTTTGNIPIGGDVILAVNGRNISSTGELASYLVLHTRPGETVTLEILRDGEKKEVTLTLGKRPMP